MLKHSAITSNRIQAWLKEQLEPRRIGEKIPLAIEFCPVAHHDQRAAEAGPWQPVEKGFEWGPAYAEAWFRLTGEVPADWEGQAIGFCAYIGGERTWWLNNVPERGIDGEHPIVDMTGFPYARLVESMRPGRRVELYIHSHAGAPHVRVHGQIPERTPTTERVDRAELLVINDALQGLYYDVEYALSLLKQVPETDPGFATVLRALNDGCNAWADEQEAAIPRIRKGIRDAYNTLSADLKHTIYACGHAHLDTAWLWPLHITHRKMVHTASTQLHLMERYPEYVYVHSQASQYEWVEKEYPDLFKRIQAAAQRGQWEPIGSMWVEADCNLTGAESLVRQFLYGRRYFKKHFGNVTDDMFLPDVFGYAAALPQILDKFGIKYFCTQKISWNDTNKFPHNTFWWQGIDGTKVWTHFPPADTYIGNCSPEEMIQSVKNHRDQARSDSSLYLFGWGDGGGGPTERHLEFLRRSRTAPYLPDVEKGKQARDFYAESRARSKDLITWSGELYLEKHRGTLTSQANNKKWNRQSEFLMRDVEWLAAMSTSPYPGEEIERVWKLILLNQFHDIIPGSSVPEVYVDSDRDYADILASSRQMLEAKLLSLGGKLDSSQAERPFALFQNATLPGQAEIDWSEEDVPASLACGDERLPVQLVEEFGERKLIFPTPHAALGAVAIGDFRSESAPMRARLKAASRRLENHEFSVRFDAHGNLSSIQTLDDSPIEFLEAGKVGNLFQVFDDRPLFWDAWDIDIYTYETVRDLVKSERFEVVERGPVRVAVEVEKRFGNSRIVQRISLGATPGIRFDTWIDWREERKLLKVAFPLNVNSNRATYEIQFGHVERPTHRNTSWDQARFEVCAQKWADLSQADYGCAILNDGKYGHDADGNVLRLSLLRSPHAPDPQCDMGEHRFTYVLLPHYDQVHHSDVIAAAYGLNAPMRAVPLSPRSGPATATPALISVQTRDVVVETVKKAEDRDLVVARMYECHNTRGRAELVAAKPIKRAWIADLNEEPQIELEVQDGRVMIDYRPFEIITVLLEL
jgi:alpha-mannosidase